jgi:hypothetical protein
MSLPSLQNSFAYVHGEVLTSNNPYGVFMKSTQDVPSSQQYFLNAVAPSGRGIEPCVFLVAQGMANQAVCYAEKFLGDSCVAVNLLEEAAASVSEVIRAKEAAQIPPIRDVRRYLFRVFLRKVAEARRKETTYEDLGHRHSHPCGNSHGDGLDNQLLLDQILDQFEALLQKVLDFLLSGRFLHYSSVQVGYSALAVNQRR